MSRPFSYSDENFTVIGNILFLHVKLTKSYKVWNHIVEIPHAIYERMYHKSLLIQISSNKDNYSSEKLIKTGIYKSDNDEKYYLYTSDEISEEYIGFYLVAWYALKDI